MIDLSVLGRELMLSQGFRRAPTRLWQPSVCGDIDIRIDAQGQWLHEGAVIRRFGLVRLLASILTYDGTDYWLITPVEKMRIQVDDVPFVLLEIQEDAPTLQAVTNVGEHLTIEQPWALTPGPDGEWRPCIKLQHGLAARLSRNLYYDLVHRASSQGTIEENQLVWAFRQMKLPMGFVE